MHFRRFSLSQTVSKISQNLSFYELFLSVFTRMLLKIQYAHMLRIRIVHTFQIVPYSYLALTGVAVFFF